MPGSDIALGGRNPRTGLLSPKWDDDGDLVFDDTEEHAVLQSLACKRGQWWADPRLGSRLHELKSIVRATSSLATAYAFEGLQPLVELKRILPPVVLVQVERSRFAVVVNTKWTTPGGTPGKARHEV